jgi:hypothetical protein
VTGNQKSKIRNDLVAASAAATTATAASATTAAATATTTSATVAAATSAATATIAATTTATAAAKSAALGLGARFVDGEIATIEVAAVELLHRRFSFAVVSHFHESEPARLAGIAIANDVDVVHLAKR